MADWVIEPLARDHIRDGFDCGKPSLTEFLHTLAGQYERRGAGRTYVALPMGQRVVVGYYTLAASSIELGRLPPKVSKKLPRHPVPAILLGRLAVDRTAQGRGLGAHLLIDAATRCARTAGDIGVFALATTAIDDEAARFYTRFGFIPLEDDPRYLYLPVETIQKLLGG
jgi:GNAT superfamily N-acetyltransferase